MRRVLVFVVVIGVANILGIAISDGKVTVFPNIVAALLLGGFSFKSRSIWNDGPRLPHDDPYAEPKHTQPVLSDWE